VPHRHPAQIQHPVGRGRRIAGGGRPDPLGSDRPSPARQDAGRRNPFHDPVREVRVRLDTGKVIRILSNDLDAAAQEIADLYKRRWAIEQFFRWVKQTLKIRAFSAPAKMPCAFRSPWL
jgi:Transposase DDE domain